jgi:hypothetical protein
MELARSWADRTISMDWREAFLSRFGPGLLTGITLGDWANLLRENRFAVDPACFPRAMALTLHGGQNSAIRRFEDWRYRARLEDVEIRPPLFVLGHWRSGTTHLHNLIAADGRFAFPNTYQAFFPHTFLTTEAINSKMVAAFLPKHRPMDNIEWSMTSPQEEEFALCIASGKSPCLGWVFPKRRDYYDRYLTMRDVPEPEVARWRAAMLMFLKKLTWKYGKPLALKSPPQTCRIRLLLAMFPGAKFVHIHRDPYAVFQSSRKTFRVNFGMNGLQKPRLHDLDEWILRQYRRMYDVFFEERGLIPVGDFHEMSFVALERDPEGQMRLMYEALGLPDFGRARPALREYLDSIAGYRKNEFPDLADDLRARIADEWRPCFDEWGYPGSKSA